MTAESYTPGKALILSRLPAQDWFSVDEAAQHSGWGRTFVRESIKAGDLAAQECKSGDARHTGKYKTCRVHVDDLVMFILRNGNGKYTEEKTFGDAAALMRTWPAWMRREMLKHLTRTLDHA